MTRYFIPSILLIIFCLGFSSCDMEDGEQELELDPEVSTEANVERNFEKSKILDPLTIDGRALESYALYLPKNYFTGYTWPTVVFLDPQGKGKKPLALYQDLADQFGFILIGSNFSRNGKPVDEILEHLNALKHDLPDGIKVDPFRVFLVGFSGGARVAVADAMTNANVAGVVGCGAGFPQLKKDVLLDFNYLAMVGTQDFNYAEFVVLDKELSARGSSHVLIEYDGKHEWASADQMLEAFKWMTIYSYSQREVIDMTMLDSLHKDDLQKLNSLANSKDLRLVGQFYKKMIAFYTGLAKVEEQEKSWGLLSSSSAYKEYQTHLETVLSEEMQSRSKLSQLMNQNSNDWWTKEIAKLRKEIAGESDFVLKKSKERILAYLSLSAYMQADAALKKDQLPHAKRCLFVFNLVDPQNPDYYYLSARLRLKQGKNEEAVNLLKEAMKYGFDDWEKVDNERVFDPIRSYLKTIG